MKSAFPKQSSPEEDLIYEAAAIEFDGPTRNVGMYTRHLVNHAGDEKLARLSYIAEYVIKNSQESLTINKYKSDTYLKKSTTPMNYKGFKIHKHGDNYFRVGTNVFHSLPDAQNFIDLGS